MAFSSGETSLTLKDIKELITEEELAYRYLGITEIPCVINSPLRVDNKPSFGVYLSKSGRIRFKDMATGENSGIYDVLSQMWGIPFEKVLTKVIKEVKNVNKSTARTLTINSDKALSAKGLIKTKEHSQIQVKTREWRKYDLNYWKSYGISLDWLKFANIFPISHKIITKGKKSYTFGADRYAYVYLEHKEGIISLKIYQPYNKSGFKWCTSTDSSVISLWTQLPDTGDKVCICSSLKDALCLWANTGIPSIATQGEAYNMSQTAIKELKRRFKNIYIIFDNDSPGLIDAEKLSKSTGFTNIVLPKFQEGKDISDLYHSLKNKQEFQKVILPLFNN